MKLEEAIVYLLASSGYGMKPEQIASNVDSILVGVSFRSDSFRTRSCSIAILFRRTALSARESPNLMSSTFMLSRFTRTMSSLSEASSRILPLASGFSSLHILAVFPTTLEAVLKWSPKFFMRNCRDSLDLAPDSRNLQTGRGLRFRRSPEKFPASCPALRVSIPVRNG